VQQWLPLLLLAVATAAAPARAAMSITGTPKVSFDATGSVMDMQGVGKVVKLADDGQQLVFTVPMSTVSTDNAVRDDHMLRTYVEVAKFPEVSVSLPKAALTLPAADGEKRKGAATGTFTARGISQPVTVSYSAKKVGGVTKLEASFQFDVSKHGIAIPDYMGVTIDPKMKASATVELIDG
jgi:polyisoprenoid-binding protein YceI